MHYFYHYSRVLHKLKTYFLLSKYIYSFMSGLVSNDSSLISKNSKE